MCAACVCGVCMCMCMCVCGGGGVSLGLIRHTKTGLEETVLLGPLPLSVHQRGYPH